MRGCHQLPAFCRLAQLQLARPRPKLSVVSCLRAACFLGGVGSFHLVCQLAMLPRQCCSPCGRHSKSRTQCAKQIIVMVACYVLRLMGSCSIFTTRTQRSLWSEYLRTFWRCLSRCPVAAAALQRRAVGIQCCFFLGLSHRPVLHKLATLIN